MSFVMLLIVGSLATSAGTPTPAAPTASPAPTPVPTAEPSPVQVGSCRVEYQGNLLVGTTGQLVINFTNYGSVTADVLRFHVQYGDQSQFIRDVGTFSPGIEIKHKFKTFEGNLQLSPLLQQQKPVTCYVSWAHFSNGTIWPAPPISQPATVPSPAV